MTILLASLLLIVPYLLFWVIWWRYARHYPNTSRVPGIADMRQAWELSTTVSYGAMARRLVVVGLVLFYAVLVSLIVTGI